MIKIFSVKLNLFKTTNKNRVDSIVDDRNESPGKKFKDADLTGIPFQLIVSEKNHKENLLELKIRSEGTSLKENKQNILTKLKP